MNLDRFLDVLATLFGGIGSLYVLRSVVSMSPSLMARLAQGSWDFSTAQIDALASQKADGIVGIVLVVIALAVALVNSAFVPPGLRAFGSRGVALSLAVGVAAISYVILWSIGGAVQQHQKREIGRVLTAQCLDRLVEKKRITNDDLQSLHDYARLLIGMPRGQGEPARQFVAKVAAETRPGAAEELDYSQVEPPAVQ